jgi:predicted nucleotidyltransferase
LLLKHTATETDVDISLGILPFEQEMVERSVVESIGILSIRLPTPEDLIIMKAVAHRPKDLEDIRTIIEKNPLIDVARIKQWVRSFGKALEMPNLWDDIAEMFK